MARPARASAVVTGASTGIGFDLTRECVEPNYDRFIAADESQRAPYRLADVWIW